MEEQRYWFEDVPEEERFWFLAWWPLFSPGKGFQATIKDDARGEEKIDTENPDTAEKVDRLVERQHEVGFVPAALRIPWWLECQRKQVHNEGREYLEAPVLFTSRERAEEEFRRIEGDEPDDYLNLRERYGETLTNAAFDRADPLRLLWVDREILLDKLEDSDFLCVMVNGVLKLRRDFMEELRKRVEPGQ